MSDNINNMDLKQLRNEVQLLRDELAIMKRKYEDIIYNLDTDNFSSRFVKEQGDMRTAIEINAEGIKTEVTNRIDADTELSSEITQNAEKIETEVTERKAEDKVLSSKITQTAEEISTSVSKQITIQFESDVMPTKKNTSDAEKGMLCEYDGTLYYYNDILEDWEEYPYDGVNSKFIQTASGFKFTNDVKIDADLIVSGTIDAERISTDIANVADTLYVGSYESRDDIKSIYFNNTVYIRTAKDGWGYYGIEIGASVLYLLRPDRIFLINPNNTSVDITLDDYIQECIDERLSSQI